MEILVFIIVVLGVLISIASGIWVTIALGSTLAANRKKRTSHKASHYSKVK